jgi:hypothetical protein
MLRRYLVSVVVFVIVVLFAPGSGRKGNIGPQKKGMGGNGV